MYSIGVDIGGTSTRLCIFDKLERTILLETSIPLGGNLTSTSAEEQEHLIRLLKDTISQYVKSTQWLTLHFAVSGAGDTARAESFRRIIESYFPEGTIQIVSDVEALKRFCIAGDKAILVICGTGSIVLGSSGRRMGGWGHLFGDEASAFSIAVKIIREFLNYIDGISEYDPVFETVMKHFGSLSPYEMANLQNVPNFKSRIASLVQAIEFTPLVRKFVDEELEILAKKVKLLCKIEKTRTVRTFGGMFQNAKFFEIFKDKLRGYEIQQCNIRLHVRLAMSDNEIKQER